MKYFWILFVVVLGGCFGCDEGSSTAPVAEGMSSADGITDLSATQDNTLMSSDLNGTISSMVGDTVPQDSAALDTIPEPDPIPVVLTAEDSLFLPAKTLYDSAQYVEAIAAFETLRTDHPEFSDPGKIQYYIAKSWYQQGLFDDAIIQFTTIISEATMSGWADDAQLYVGKSYYGLGATDSTNYFTAVTEFDKVMSLYATSSQVSDALYEKARSYNQIGDFDLLYVDSAFATFEEYRTTYTTGADLDGASYNIGKILFDKAHYAEATTELSDFVSNYSTSHFIDNGYYYLARSQLETQDNAGANVSFSAIISGYPTSIYLDNSYYYRGKTRNLLGLADPDSSASPLFDQSLADLNKYLIDYPTGVYLSEAQLYVGENYFFKDEFTIAITELEKVEANYPTSAEVPTALYYLGRTQMGMAIAPNAEEHFIAAIPYFDRILRDFPGSVRLDDAQFQKAKSIYRLGGTHEAYGIARNDTKLTESIDEFKLILSTYTGSSKTDQALLYLVRAYSEQADCGNANFYLDQLKADYPTSLLTSHAENHSAYRENSCAP